MQNFFASMFIFEENIKLKFVCCILIIHICIYTCVCVCVCVCVIILIIKLFNIFLKTNYIYVLTKKLILYIFNVKWHNNIHEYIVFKVLSHIFNILFNLCKIWLENNPVKELL